MGLIKSTGFGQTAAMLLAMVIGFMFLRFLFFSIGEMRSLRSGLVLVWVGVLKVMLKSVSEVDDSAPGERFSM